MSVRAARLLAGLAGGVLLAEARVYLGSGRVGVAGRVRGLGWGYGWGYRVEARVYLVLAMLRIGIE